MAGVNVTGGGSNYEEIMRTLRGSATAQLQGWAQLNDSLQSLNKSRQTSRQLDLMEQQQMSDDWAAMIEESGLSAWELTGSKPGRNVLRSYYKARGANERDAEMLIRAIGTTLNAGIIGKEMQDYFLLHPEEFSTEMENAGDVANARNTAAEITQGNTQSDTTGESGSVSPATPGDLVRKLTSVNLRDSSDPAKKVTLSIPFISAPEEETSGNQQPSDEPNIAGRESITEQPQQGAVPETTNLRAPSEEPRISSGTSDITEESAAPGSGVSSTSPSNPMKGSSSAGTPRVAPSEDQTSAPPLKRYDAEVRNPIRISGPLGDEVSSAIDSNDVEEDIQLGRYQTITLAEGHPWLEETGLIAKEGNTLFSGTTPATIEKLRQALPRVSQAKITAFAEALHSELAIAEQNETTSWKKYQQEGAHAVQQSLQHSLLFQIEQRMKERFPEVFEKLTTIGPDQVTAREIRFQIGGRAVTSDRAFIEVLNFVDVNPIASQVSSIEVRGEINRKKSLRAGERLLAKGGRKEAQAGAAIVTQTAANAVATSNATTAAELAEELNNAQEDIYASSGDVNRTISSMRAETERVVRETRSQLREGIEERIATGAFGGYRRELQTTDDGRKSYETVYDPVAQLRDMFLSDDDKKLRELSQQEDIERWRNEAANQAAMIQAQMEQISSGINHLLEFIMIPIKRGYDLAETPAEMNQLFESDIFQRSHDFAVAFFAEMLDIDKSSVTLQEKRKLFTGIFGMKELSTIWLLGNQRPAPEEDPGELTPDQGDIWNEIFSAGE